LIDKIAVNPQKIVAPNAHTQPSTSGVDISKQFSQFLNDAIDKTNEQKRAVDTLTKQFISGDLTDVHQLMIAAEKSSLGLELTVQVRNKVIDAYQEIMRMQI
jgi:flagellar hook-basal body complex protein FliE